MKQCDGDRHRFALTGAHGAWDLGTLLQHDPRLLSQRTFGVSDQLERDETHCPRLAPSGKAMVTVAGR